MKTPKISIITVVLNAARELEDTINIVVNQTYLDKEYIIIDGGSVDGKIDIIKKYEDKITYWISEKDSLIFDSFSQVLKLIALFFILILLGYIIKMVLDGHNILMIIVIPLILLPITILLYKVFGLVRLEDIHRYFGTNNKISKVLGNIYST